MKCNEKGQSLIKEFESLKLKAYLCPAGVWTIGWGHTRNAHEGMEITTARAQEYFQEDVEKFEQEIDATLEVPLNENQYAALVSFTFNAGPSWLVKSTLLSMLQEGNTEGAAGQFIRWVYARSNGRQIRLAGLVRRRNAEAALFREPVA